jgi:hypothetical protein
MVACLARLPRRRGVEQEEVEEHVVEQLEALPMLHALIGRFRVGVVV